MNVLIRRRSNCDVVIRIDVEQMARVLRTNRVYPMVTWFYEEDADGTACSRAFIAPAIKRATDAFLLKWLDMNGR
ncbi:MAG: hypothetical protein ACREBE_01175 [bacterium]